MATAQKRWTLLRRADRWLLAHRDGGKSIMFEFTSETDQELAASVAATLLEHRYRGEGIVLGVDSFACLVGGISIDDPRMLRNRQRLVYEFEEGLPVAAEELTVDFAVTEGRALGVAVQTARWASLLSSLQEAGVQVQLMIPAALLAAKAVVDTKQREPIWLLWEDESHIELIVIRDGAPDDWRMLPADPSLLAQHVAMRLLDAAPPARVLVRSASDATRNALTSQSDLPLEFAEGFDSLADAAVESGDRLLRGSATPWIDLRRDALASSDPYKPVRGLLSLVTAAAVLLLLAASGVLLFRAHRYEQAANAYLVAQEDVFRDTLPGRRLPRGILRVLESELAQASGLTGQGADLPDHVSMLIVVRELLSALPQGLRFRLNEIRLEQGRINIDGEVRTHADGDELATALRRQGFLVPAPRTQQLPNQGVSIRLTAEYKPPKPPKDTDKPDANQDVEPAVASVLTTNPKSEI